MNSAACCGPGVGITPSCAERRRQTACLKASGAKLVVIEFDASHPKIFPTKKAMTKAVEPLLSRFAHGRIRRSGACLRLLLKIRLNLTQEARSFRTGVFLLRGRAILCHRNDLGIPSSEQRQQTATRFFGLKEPASASPCCDGRTRLSHSMQQFLLPASRARRDKEDCSFLVEFLCGIERSEAPVDAACALQSC